MSKFRAMAIPSWLVPAVAFFVRITGGEIRVSGESKSEKKKVNILIG